MFKIEKGFTPPTRSRRGKPRKYPFGDMEVGDSFYVPIKDRKTVGNLNASISTARKRLGISLISDMDGNGIRVWRIGPNTKNPLKPSPDKRLQS